MATITFGSDLKTINYNPLRLDAMRFQYTGESGSLSRLEVYLKKHNDTGDTYIKFGIYSDNAGAPNALLWGASDPVLVVKNDTDPRDEWVYVEGITGVSITKNAYYWLAMAAATNRAYYYAGAVPADHHCRISPWTYADAWPNPFGEPSSYDNSGYSMRGHVVEAAASTNIVLNII